MSLFDCLISVSLRIPCLIYAVECYSQLLIIIYNILFFRDLARGLLFKYAELEINRKKKEASMRLKDIKKDYNLINSVDWEMTPEEAIALHLEWGPLRSQSYYNSRDNTNETVYFVINTWKKNPILTLVRRKGFDSEELGSFDLPKDVVSEFMQGIGKYKGVYAVEGKVKDWLKKELDA